MKKSESVKNTLPIYHKRNTINTIKKSSPDKENVWIVPFSKNKQIEGASTIASNIKKELLAKRNSSNRVILANRSKEIEMPSKDGTKIFICIGGYPAVRQALVDRGWIENPDANR